MALCNDTALCHVRLVGRGNCVSWAAFALVAACSGPRPTQRQDVRDRGEPEVMAAEPALDPALPGEPGDFAPSLARVRGSGAVVGRDLADAEACAPCHAAVVAEWQSSAHAFASFDNPIYRGSVDGFRAARGARASRLCGACHDIALLVDGALETEVAAGDPRTRGGVGCLVCHGISDVTRDGNGSYTLDTDPVPIPREGDPLSLAAHVARLTPRPLRTAELCGSCHRVFLGEESGNGHHLAGQDDFGPWARSAHARTRARIVDEPIPGNACRGCHMPLEEAAEGDAAATEGRVASHRFVGAHRWLASMRADEAGPARYERFWEGKATIDIAAVAGGGRAPLLADELAAGVGGDARRAPPLGAGDELVVDVVVRNQGAGHQLPGGTRDANDLWIAVELRTASGLLVASAGSDEAIRDFRAPAVHDPALHRFFALPIDEHGGAVTARQIHAFAAVAYDETLAPRDATLVEYALDLPRWLEPRDLPLAIRARLYHRSRTLAVQAAACAAHESPRGRSFAAAARRAGRPALDPCARQPVAVVAEAVLSLGTADDAERGAPREVWRRLYEHGLGASHAVQEKLERARTPLERLLAIVPEGGSADDRLHRAMAMALLGDVTARQGRCEQALAWLDQAEAELGAAHPAIDRARGRSYAQVWRWADAVPWLARAAEAAPFDDDAWARLGIAAGSAGLDRQALDAALAGLDLTPRSADLLRVQALALRSLDPVGAGAEAGAAFSTFLRHRLRDDAPALRAACSRTVPGCALERQPVHRHPLVPHPERPR